MSFVTVKYIEHLQKSTIDFQLVAYDRRKNIGCLPQQLWRVHGVGKYAKNQPLSEDVSLDNVLTTGMYKSNLQLAYLIKGSGQDVNLYIGEGKKIITNNNSSNIFSSLIRAAYPATNLRKAPLPKFDLFTKSGFALGIPALKTDSLYDGGLPIDRLIQAMFSTEWAVLILAEPYPRASTRDLIYKTSNEMRNVSLSISTSDLPSQLADHYLMLLNSAFNNYNVGANIGIWRTAVYLLGDDDSYYRLESVWSSMFSDVTASIEPIQIIESNVIKDLASNWAMLNEPVCTEFPITSFGKEPCYFHHPYKYQTLLTSAQLSNYIHLPHMESNGFAIQIIPAFDMIRTVNSDSKLSLGSIVSGSRFVEEKSEHIIHSAQTYTDYEINHSDLMRHTLVVGVTGSGKTNSIINILEQLHEKDIPFMVIEPSKTEYRELLDDSRLKSDFHIFTLGNELSAPFRFNPFDVIGWPDTSIATHIGLLRSVFSVSFGMWTPLPQILERCLYEIYEDKGWDITQNRNIRVPKDIAVEQLPFSVFPTLTDLYTKIETVVEQLGYHDEFTMAARAALCTRIDSLRTGGKGAMLDTHRSHPLSDLMTKPTILELEAMGDDDDKAFVMGLLFIAIVEYRRMNGFYKDLQHLVVIEEAHRLFQDIPKRQHEYEADARGKAVESIANMLAEVRAYGQGIVLADQIPVKLAPDAIKNTNLKIVHRLLAADDRLVIAGATAMNGQQATSLTTFPVGYSAVFAEGDDTPILINIPSRKSDQANLYTDSHIRKLWMGNIKGHLENVYSREPNGENFSGMFNSRQIRTIGNSPSFKHWVSSLVLSMVLCDEENETAYLQNITKMINITLIELRPLLPESWRISSKPDAWNESCILFVLYTAIVDNIHHRGMQYSWSYLEVEELISMVMPIMDSVIKPLLNNNQLNQAEATENTRKFSTRYKSLCKRVGPFYKCDLSCEGTCYHRYAVEEIDGGYLLETAQAAADAQQAGEQNKQEQELANFRKELSYLKNYISNQIFLPGASKKYIQQATNCAVIQHRHLLRQTLSNQLLFVDFALDIVRET